MQLIRKLVNVEFISQYFDKDKNICFFDIETTGLSREYNYVYLVGLMYYSSFEESFVIEQIWIDSEDSEVDLLKYSIDKLNNFDYIINYNGTSFDIPFINARSKASNLLKQVDPSKSFDIYRLLRKNKNKLNLDNLKLETVEEFLGIYREDSYSGLECITFYLDYQKSKNSSLKDKILLHNFEDLLYLNEILVIIDILFKDQSFSINLKDEIMDMIIEEYKFKNDYLYLYGSYKNKNDINLSSFINNSSFKFNDNLFEITLEAKYGNLLSNIDVPFIDLRDYNLNINKLIFKNDPHRLPCNIALLELDSNINIYNLKVLLTILLNNLNM